MSYKHILLFTILFGFKSVFCQNIYHNNVGLNSLDSTEQNIIHHLNLFLLNYDSLKHQYWDNEVLNTWGDNVVDNQLQELLNYPQFFPKALLGIIETEIENHFFIKIALSYNIDSTKNAIPIVYNLIAKYENKQVKFLNYTDWLTKNWYTKQVGNLFYLKESKANFSVAQAKKMNKFNNYLANWFKTKPKTIRYYSCKNSIELFNIKGYDFINNMFLNYNGGLAEIGKKGTAYENILFSGYDTELYKHELVHFYVNDLILKETSLFAMEGVTTFLGGSNLLPLDYHAKKLRAYLQKNPNFDVFKLLKENIMLDNKTSALYTLGAIVAQGIYEKKGFEGIKQFLNTSEKDMPATLFSLLEINKENNKKDFLNFIYTEQ